MPHETPKPFPHALRRTGRQGQRIGNPHLNLHHGECGQSLDRAVN
jgi:hypothetical protein